MDDAIEDIFEDGLLSLFDHHPVAFSTPSPSTPYIYRPSVVPFPPVSNSNAPKHVPDLEIPVYLPVAPSALHTTLQLTHIWLSSVFMADLIFSGHIPVQNQRVCELGAGAGLPSVAALLNLHTSGTALEEDTGKGSVVATDYAVPEQDTRDGQAEPEDVLGVLRSNLRAASEIISSPSDTGGRKTDDWAVVGHTWGEPITHILSSPATSSASGRKGQFDLLLLADLLWSSSSHMDLLTSCLSLLAPRTGVGHVIAGLHQGRGATERFKSGWKEAGGWVEDVAEVRWGTGGWEVFQRGEGEVVGDEERGVIVWFKIGHRGERTETT